MNHRVTTRLVFKRRVYRYLYKLQYMVSLTSVTFHINNISVFPMKESDGDSC